MSKSYKFILFNLQNEYNSIDPVYIINLKIRNLILPTTYIVKINKIDFPALLSILKLNYIYYNTIVNEILEKAPLLHQIYFFFFFLLILNLISNYG